MRVTEVSTRGISPARSAAFLVLEEVAGGAYASDVLRDKASGLTARDAGLAGQIVFGSLRFMAQLDFLIERYSGRAAERLDLPVRVALRAAVFQLRYLERIPAHAAVHESVEWVKRRKRSAAGLTNAVLRKVTRDETPWPDEATALSCPQWLLARWSEHFGSGAARGIAMAGLQEPQVYIRVRPGCESPGELCRAGVTIEATDVAGCWRVVSGGAAGLRLHDISSQAIVPLLDLRAGQSYLDLCAAPGNKTLQALEADPALAVACDVSFRRLREMPAICPRVVLDAAAPLPFERTFDRVFIDAPCSGTGTIGRNPEIKWRVKEQDFERFGVKQRAILQRGLDVLAPGGRLLYATCSLEKEENEASTLR